MALFPSPKIGAPHIWNGLKIGLLGGSFNPAHDGHRHISLEALKRLKLDAVWWMVSPQNPLKPSKGMAPQSDRLQTAITNARHNRIIPVTIENDLKTQYTSDTLTLLTQHFPKTQFVWLMGMDNFHQFHKWRNWQNIAETMPIAVLDRPPHHNSVKNSVMGQVFARHEIQERNADRLPHTPAPAWSVLHIPLNPLSATEIRQKNSN